MSDTQQNEIKNIGNLLATTAEIAEQAGITGMYEDGARRCVQQYNASVKRLEELTAIPPGFFSPVPAEAGFGEVGIACAQLAAYLGAKSPESGAVYHGSKYHVLHNHNEGLSQEEQQELREIREMLRHLSNKKDERSNP
ncbi:MAG: hypothetical protein JWL77_47 [Chthonomonadaceae bacterium]|nr:hypothetical protein [Chthonomonadaceae bacterium]